MLWNKFRYYFNMTWSCGLILIGIYIFFESGDAFLSLIACGVGAFFAFGFRGLYYNRVKCKKCNAPFAILEDHRDFLRASGSYSEKDKDGKVKWYENRTYEVYYKCCKCGDVFSREEEVKTQLN